MHIQEKMREFLSYHVVVPRKYLPEITNNLKMDSLLPGQQVRLKFLVSSDGLPAARTTGQSEVSCVLNLIPSSVAEPCHFA